MTEKKFVFLQFSRNTTSLQRSAITRDNLYVHFAFTRSLHAGNDSLVEKAIIIIEKSGDCWVQWATFRQFQKFIFYLGEAGKRRIQSEQDKTSDTV